MISRNQTKAERDSSIRSRRLRFGHLGRTACLIALSLLFSATAMDGCGSSSTSPTEAHTITVAEQSFLAKWREAEEAGVKCSQKNDLAGTRCYEEIVVPRQGRAMFEFSESIKALLDAGVGRECADALKDTLSAMNSVPSFPGSGAASCRAESHQ